MTSTPIGTVRYTLSADYLATIGADFDVEAIDNAILAKLNSLVPDGVVVHRNGIAYAEEGAVDGADEIDWDELLSRIDIDQILADHAR